MRIKHTIEIDQSGKIEDTAKDTVLAFSNNEIGAVILRAREKRKLQEMFREIAAPRLYVDYVFSSLLVFLLKTLRVSSVTIDKEYPSHEKIIESLINVELSTEIKWRCIGKTSKAHDIAYKVFTRKLLIGKKTKAREVWNMAKKITGGYLKTGLSPANRYSAPVSKSIIAHKDKNGR